MLVLAGQMSAQHAVLLTGLAHAHVCCACLCSCSKVFTADEVADTVVGILDKLGVKEACVVGHSYGTVSLQDPA